MNEEHEPAPAAASTGTSVRKQLRQWAEEKKCDPSSPGDEKHFYAGALARWHWVDTIEVTEAEFDEAIAYAKNIPIGIWPHPTNQKAEVR